MSHSGNYESFVKHDALVSYSPPQGQGGAGSGGGFTIPGKRTGAIIVAANAAAALTGCLVGMGIFNVSAHPPAPVVTGSDFFMDFKANAADPTGHVAGYSSPGIFNTTRAVNPIFQTRVKAFSTTVANARMYIGFSSTNAPTLPISNTPLAPTDSGIILGFNPSTTDFSVFSNDGTGGVMTTSDLGVVKDTLFHVYTIRMTPTSVICQIDVLTPVILTTSIPGLLTSLNLFLNFDQT